MIHPLRIPRAIVLLAAVALSGSSLQAQTGPFQDGELLVRVPIPSSSFEALYRINPSTGHGALAVTNLFPSYSGADWITYDPYRARLLAYTAWQPTGVFSPKLFAIGADGSMTDLGFADAKLTSLTPVGDGRVYVNANQKLAVIAANNSITPILDHLGQPFDQYYPYLAFSATLNSLIGVASVPSTAPCFQASHLVVARLPLNAAGTQLTGPVICNSYDIQTGPVPVGLDPLPNGDLLVTLTAIPVNNDRVLLRLNPATLAVSIWSPSTLVALDGGVWSQHLQRVIVLDDISNQLRTYLPGQGSGGTFLPVDVPVGDAGTGNSVANKMIDIELQGPGCSGFASPFGAGLAGTGGVVPSLNVTTCPKIGGPIGFLIAGAIGQSTGALVLSATSGPYPLLGGTFYIVPPSVLLPLATNGATGVAGAGTATLNLGAPLDPTLIGVSFYAQVGIVDNGGPAGYAFTNPIELRLGG